MESLLEKLSNQQKSDSGVILSNAEIEMLNMVFKELTLLGALATVKWNLGFEWSDLCKPALKTLLNKINFDDRFVNDVLNPKH